GDPDRGAQDAAPGWRHCSGISRSSAPDSRSFGSVRAAQSQGGTQSSNPSSSCGESRANLKTTSTYRCHVVRPPWAATEARSQTQRGREMDSNLYGAFPVKWVVLGFAESSLFGAGKPFFIPSPTIRFAERAEGVKGPGDNFIWGPE